MNVLGSQKGDQRSLYDLGFMKLLAALDFAERVFYYEPRQFTSSFLFSSVSKITNRQQVVLFTVFYSICFRKSRGKRRRANIHTFLQKSGLKAVNLTSKKAREPLLQTFFFSSFRANSAWCSSESSYTGAQATYLLAAQKST